MNKSETKVDKSVRIRAEKLMWILNEWDCGDSIEKAKEMAKTDEQLNYALREAGIKL